MTNTVSYRYLIVMNKPSPAIVYYLDDAFMKKKKRKIINAGKCLFLRRVLVWRMAVRCAVYTRRQLL
jgi:hypothetical protein